MSRLLIVSLGQLGGAVLEAVARTGAFDEIVVAGRSPERARRKVNNARVGAAIEGHYARIEAVAFDFNAADAAERLARIDPDVVFTAPSLMAWWALDRLPAGLREKAAAVPFGGFIAFHLAPLLALRDAWAASGCAGHWVNGSYPDVVNAVLAATGPAPASGVGNIVEAVPKVRFAAAEALGVAPGQVDVRLVAQHALEYHFYSEARAAETPPFLLQATVAGRDVTAAISELLFAPFPIPYEADFNLLTASAAAVLLPAFVSARPVATHVPGPQGLVGGYPVRVSRDGIALDLPPEWTLAEARAVNGRSMAHEGIAGIEADGCVRFTDSAAAALGALLGRPASSLRPTDAAGFAAELRAALAPG